MAGADCEVGDRRRCAPRGSTRRTSSAPGQRGELVRGRPSRRALPVRARGTRRRAPRRARRGSRRRVPRLSSRCVGHGGVTLRAAVPSIRCRPPYPRYSRFRSWGVVATCAWVAVTRGALGGEVMSQVFRQRVGADPARASRWGHAGPDDLRRRSSARWPLLADAAGARTQPGGKPLVSVTFIVLMLVTFVEMRKHDRGLCERCVADFPLNPAHDGRDLQPSAGARCT